VKKSKEILFHLDVAIQPSKRKPLDDAALERIMDALVLAVEKEKACMGGGMHELGALRTCCTEGINVCRECLEEIICKKCVPS